MSYHGIKVVTLKTGLSPHVIRVWEKRYSAVIPERSDTNRRLYSDQSLDRLVKLATLTRLGHSIGQIANLPNDKLDKLHDSSTANPVTKPGASNPPETQHYVDKALAAIVEINQQSLEITLDEAIKKIGYSGLLEKVLLPLIIRVGEAWHNGDISAAEEHAATSFIKDYLCISARSYSTVENAPTLLVTTPAGQLHELGAVVAASQARKTGWKVIYLGPSLPADEIAGACEKVNAKALMLSLVYPVDDPQMDAQLNRIRKQVGYSLPIIVGGSAAKNYRDSLQSIEAKELHSLQELNALLTEIRGQYHTHGNHA